MVQLFLKGLIVHLVADWMLQSDWMSENKTSLRHPAAWVHSGIHTVGYLLVFAWPVALALGVSHILIDTRVPLRWVRKLVNQNPGADSMSAFGIWQDQAAHIILLAAACLLSAGS
jgi:hypothetical protein